MTTPRRILAGSTVGALMLALSGCFGMYDNTKQFLNDPVAGISDIEVLNTYGAPDSTISTAAGQVLTYKVRDTKYIVLVGLYQGYDLMVRIQDGAVVDSQRVPIPQSFSLLQPWPWLVTE